MTSRQLSNLDQRVEWLLRHRKFLVGVLDLGELVKAMKRDGLLAKTSYVHDCRHGLEAAVKAARFRWYEEHNGRDIKL